MKKKVFLGGTCNNSSWREDLIPMLKINHFNPVVDDWTEECMKEEIKQRQICDFCLYVITPKMAGVYSIAEVVDDSNKRPEKTLFLNLYDNDEQFPHLNEYKQMAHSLKAVENLLKENGVKVFDTLEDTAEFLNLAANVE